MSDTAKKQDNDSIKRKSYSNKSMNQIECKAPKNMNMDFTQPIVEFTQRAAFGDPVIYTCETDENGGIWF